MSSRSNPLSRRSLGATVLLISAVAVVVAGVSVRSIPGLVAAATWAAMAGVFATQLLALEITALRHAWAVERTAVARENSRTAIRRSTENTDFAVAMGARLKAAENTIAALRDEVVTAEIGLAQARERLWAERHRVDALEAEVGIATSELRSARADLQRASDALAASESAELQAKAELLAWEESTSEADRTQRDRSA